MPLNASFMLAALAVLVVPGAALGQDAVPASAATATAPAGCLPRCRSGYYCDAGACVALPDPHDRRHEGFFLRFEVGPGLVDARLGDIEASGLGYQLGIAIGAAVVENLIVMVSANELIARNVESSLDASAQALFGQSIRIDLGVDEATLGVGYYLMPANVLLGAHVGIGFAQINANGIESDLGPSFGLDVAKEFWVSNAWGLGAGLRLVWMMLPLDERFRDTSEQDDVDVLDGRLSFIATFN